MKVHRQRQNMSMCLRRSPHQDLPHCQQANGGAVVIGDGVNATFDLCTFLGNGVPPCAEVQSTLVRTLR